MYMYICKVWKEGGPEHLTFPMFCILRVLSDGSGIGCMRHTNHLVTWPIQIVNLARIRFILPGALLPGGCLCEPPSAVLCSYLPPSSPLDQPPSESSDMWSSLGRQGIDRRGSTVAEWEEWSLPTVDGGEVRRSRDQGHFRAKLFGGIDIIRIPNHVHALCVAIWSGLLHLVACL